MTIETSPNWEKIAKRLARNVLLVRKISRMSYAAEDFEVIQRHFRLAERVNKKGYTP